MEPDVRVFSPDQLSTAAATLLAAEIKEVVAARGRCRFALAGGGTPVPVYQRLAWAPLATSIPWESVEMFFGDERAVRLDDPGSNYAMVKGSLLDHISIPAENVHRIHCELPPEEAARAYAEVLGDEPLDITLLGMGDDGHTASLFPGTPDLDGGAPVRVSQSPIPPTDRVTLSLRVLNRSRAIYLLVAGATKAARLAEIKRQIESGAPVLPAARLQPTDGRLVWLIDQPAAAQFA